MVDPVEALKAEMSRRGITQNELGREVGADSAVISRVMTRKRKPNLEIATAIERVFGIPASAWVTPANDSGEQAADGAAATGTDPHTS